MNGPNEPLDLQDLILLMKGDRTYRGLEDSTGGVVKSQRWNQLANRQRINEFPEPRTIQAMADALNVNAEVVLLSFARNLGLDVGRSRSRFADLLPPMVDKLTDKQRDAILAVIRAMIDPESKPVEAEDKPAQVVVKDASGRKVAGSKKKPR